MHNGDWSPLPHDPKSPLAGPSLPADPPLPGTDTGARPATPAYARWKTSRKSTLCGLSSSFVGMISRM